MKIRAFITLVIVVMAVVPLVIHIAFREEAESAARVGRGCPVGYEYRVAGGSTKVEWRDYCLSEDGTEALDPHWIYAP